MISRKAVSVSKTDCPDSDSSILSPDSTVESIGKTLRRSSETHCHIFGTSSKSAEPKVVVNCTNAMTPPRLIIRVAVTSLGSSTGSSFERATAGDRAVAMILLNERMPACFATLFENMGV